MMEKMRFFNINKKTEGGSTYVATLVSIFVMIALFAALFYNFAQISAQNKIERTYRQYLLVMETQGYLSPSAKAQLIADLNADGLINVDLTGTTESMVAYGGTITLHIQGDLVVDRVKKNGGSLVRGQEVVHVDIKKTGTALY